MGAGIIIPVVVVAIVVPAVLLVAKRYLKGGAGSTDDLPDELVLTPAIRLASRALRELPSPRWRVVHEIADDRLGGPTHVLIGPPGVFAVETSIDPMPSPPAGPPDPRTVARAAIARGGLDDALRRCGLTSRCLVTIHWAARPDTAPDTVETAPGSVAVDGRSLATWAARSADGDASLSPDQVDLAWRTVTTAIGRPDPLA